MRKTKIICTLGPSTDDPAVLRQLMLSGMDVARVNMSHQNHDSHRRRIEMVKKLREELQLPVAVLIDTKGPEIRLGTFKEPRVELRSGRVVRPHHRDGGGGRPRRFHQLSRAAGGCEPGKPYPHR